MKSSVLQLAFGLLVLVLGAGMEECLPKVLGVGFPVLLAMAGFIAASKLPMAESLVIVVAAGAFEDALSAFPAMTSVSYFLVMALLFRIFRLPGTAVLLAYPLYQVWLSVWTSFLGGGAFVRLLLSIPLGIITTIVIDAVMSWFCEKVAVNERG